MEYFVVADTHAFYSEMIEALHKAGFDENNSEHIIIHCGDMLDRGTEVIQTLDFFYKLFLENRLVFIRGNHEDLFDQMVKRRYYLKDIDVPNGTVLSLYLLSNKKENKIVSKKELHSLQYRARIGFNTAVTDYDRHWDELRASSIDFYETKNHIFVHGWIPVLEYTLNEYKYDKDWRTASEGEWVLARWLNGIECAGQGVIEPNKTIVCGHYTTKYGHVKRAVNAGKLRVETENGEKSWDDVKKRIENDLSYYATYSDNGIIALDASTYNTHKVNVLHFREDEI